MKHTPATPLPWIYKAHKDAHVYGPMNFNLYQEQGRIPVGEHITKEDAAYIVHAANKYPELVKALQYMMSEIRAWQPDNASWQSGEEEADCFMRARALLRSLGEDV
jgi:hypothetical protein